MDHVHCAVHCAVYSVQGELCSGQCAICSIKFAGISVKCSVCTVARTVYRTVFSSMLKWSTDMYAVQSTHRFIMLEVDQIYSLCHP